MRQKGKRIIKSAVEKNATNILFNNCRNTNLENN